MFEESVNARYTCTTQCCNLPIKAEPNVEFFDIHSLHFSNLVRTYEYGHSSYIRKHNSTLFFFVSHETNWQGFANAKRCCISSWLQSFFLWVRKWGQNLEKRVNMRNFLVSQSSMLSQELFSRLLETVTIVTNTRKFKTPLTVLSIEISWYLIYVEDTFLLSLMIYSDTTL